MKEREEWCDPAPAPDFTEPVAPPAQQPQQLPPSPPSPRYRPFNASRKQSLGTRALAPPTPAPAPAPATQVAIPMEDESKTEGTNPLKAKRQGRPSQLDIDAVWEEVHSASLHGNPTTAEAKVAAVWTDTPDAMPSVQQLEAEAASLLQHR